MITRFTALAAFSLFTLPSSVHAAAGAIELIADAPSVSVARGETTFELKRGEEIQNGDVITTGKATVYLKLPRFNEMQLAPGTVLTIEEINIPEKDTEDGTTAGRSLIVLQEGIIWGLIANGVSLAAPLYIRTPELALGVPGSNFVMEHSTKARTTTVLALEGNVRFARTMNDLTGARSSSFLNAGMRLAATAGKAQSPKAFKRHLLVSYLNKKARVTAKDMTNRGARALSAISKKETAANSADQITWILPPGVGTTPSSNNGSMQPGQQPNGSMQ